MSCCGKKREQLHLVAQTRQANETAQSVPAQPRPTRYAVVYFEYLGATGLTVLGPVTGNRYRFDRHGARVAVDLRDRLSMAAVPNLRQVTNL
ncbi:MAG TPA: hypothetical protein VJ810_20725 [Blastocatellia bacterium]|nr:hypothetical protein [Blastocatellia bacterium]